MALVRSEDDFKKYLTAPNNLSYEALSASILYAESKFANKVLGSTLYIKLNAGITDEDLTDDENLLLDEVYKMIGLMAYAHYVGLGNAKVTDQGITAVHTQNEKPAFEWQVKQMQRASLEMAFTAVEDLLLYLESVKDNFSDWTSSAAFTEFQELFIATASDFSKFWSISNSRLTYLALVPKIRFVEDFYLDTLLGSEYITELRTQSKADALTAPNKVVMNLLKHYIARKTIEAGLEGLSVEVSVFGLVKNYSTSSVNSSRPADAVEREALIANAVKEADMYRLKLLKTIYDDIDSYATYKASDSYVDPVDDDDFPDRNVKKFGSFLRT